jgi:L-2-hydroxyglutarate oxidase LhgO
MTVAMLNSIYSLYPRPALRHHFFWSSTFSAAACLATVCIASPTCSVADAAMRDIDLLFSLLTSARDAMPASWFRRDVDWFVQLRNKALAAKAQAQTQSHIREVDNGPSPETDAELEIVGWRTKLVKRSERVEDDFSQSQQPWTITANMEAQPAADAGMNGMSAEDWVRFWY